MGNTMSKEQSLNALEDILVAFGKDGDEAAIGLAQRKYPTCLDSFTSVHDITGVVRRSIKSDKQFRAGLTVAYALWMVMRQGVGDIGFALDAASKLGLEAISYEGDTSRISDALTSRQTALDTATAKRTAAGKRVPLLKAAGKTYLAKVDEQIAGGAPKADIDAVVDELVAELTMRRSTVAVA